MTFRCFSTSKQRTDQACSKAGTTISKLSSPSALAQAQIEEVGNVVKGDAPPDKQLEQVKAIVNDSASDQLRASLIQQQLQRVSAMTGGVDAAPVGVDWVALQSKLQKSRDDVARLRKETRDRAERSRKEESRGE